MQLDLYVVKTVVTNIFFKGIVANFHFDIKRIN